GLACQLDDEPAVAGDLHDRLGRPELVDARTHDTLGSADRVRAIGYHAARLIHPEREMHAPPEVEPPLDGHSATSAIAHLSSLRVVQSLLYGTWHEREHARGHEGEDDDHSPLDGFHVDGSLAWRPRAGEAASRDASGSAVHRRRIVQGAPNGATAY